MVVRDAIALAVLRLGRYLPMVGDWARDPIGKPIAAIVGWLGSAALAAGLLAHFTRLRLRPRELELATYLCLHRTSRSGDTITTMLRPDGCSSQTWKNLVSMTRKRLGRDPEHRDLLPESRDARYKISDRVVTDWEQFQALMKAADLASPNAARSLRQQAFDLIEGPAFSDVPKGYSWAFSDRLVARITLSTVRDSVQDPG